MKFPRRVFLKGVGGTVLGLPFLESLQPKIASAGTKAPPFAIFFRQANGVAQEGENSELGFEPERFFPTALGALTEASMAGRAVDELVAYRDRLLIVRNVNMSTFNYNDGHANGALQGLTAQGPTVAGAAGDSEAAGESLDHRIGRELNPDGRDSLFLYAGDNNGWLGGPCISYRDAALRRSAIVSPWEAYQTIVGGSAGLDEKGQMLLGERRQSVNDLVRGQLTALQGLSRLSASDRDRLDLHLQAVRDLEVSLSCRLTAEEEAALQGASAKYDVTNGDEVLATAQLHMEVAALAVACGFTRSVAIQVGSGNDGSTRYRNPDSGDLMENYHYISHRRLSHDSSGAIIENGDILHHYVDRQFGAAFRHLLERLDMYPSPDGKTMLSAGVAIWYNDNANGPPHSSTNVPYILAGSAGGFLRQGEFVEVTPGSDDNNHSRLLNTIGSAVGLRNKSGDFLDDFGESSLPSGTLNDLLA